MKTILFVCTGNTCRSPMARALFEKLLAQSGIDDVKAESAGIAAHGGDAASKNAVAALDELGINLKSHKARQVTKEDIEAADKIYTMSRSHAEILKRTCPDAAPKIEVLGGGIPDPFGGDITVYRSCRDLILAALKNIIDKVK